MSRKLDGQKWKCEQKVRRRTGKAKNNIWIFRSNINLDLKIRLLKNLHLLSSRIWKQNMEIQQSNKRKTSCLWNVVLKGNYENKLDWECNQKKLLETTGHQKVLVNWMIKRKMRFAGHIMRGSSRFLARLVLEGIIDGKGDRGRQIRTWGDNVKESSVCEIIGRAKWYSEDRYSWRVIVANLLIEDGAWCSQHARNH